MFTACTLTSAVTFTCLIGLAGQDDRGSNAPNTRSAGALEARLRAEAARVQKVPASELFAALSDLGADEALRLSKTQAELVARLDQFGRDVESAWLIRGLDGQARPPDAELAERLAEPGQRLRAGVVWQIEAIALESVLEPGQAKCLLAKSHRRPPKQMVDEYRSFSVPVGATPTANRGHAYRQIRSMIAMLAAPTYHPSELGKIFLDEGRALGFSAAQTELMRRLDKLTRDVTKDWLARGLDGPEPRPTDPEWLNPVPSKMEDRLSEEGRRLRVSLLLRSEAITLVGILKPEQAFSSKRLLWSRCSLDLLDARAGGSHGISALLDPEVGTRLGLSKAQRDDLGARIDELRVLAQGLHGQVFEAKMATQSNLNDGGFLADEQAVVSAARAQIRQAEQAVWDVLRPRQRRAFQQLISIPNSAQPEGKTPSASKRPL